MEDHLNMFLSSKLYMLRRQANIKQSELAEKLKISQQAYSKLETGVTRFTDHTIDTLCECFQISREEFLDLKTEKNARQSGLDVGQVEPSTAEKIPDQLSLLIMEELGNIREERKMLIEFITNQALEYKCERAALLRQIKEMREKEYRLS